VLVDGTPLTVISTSKRVPVSIEVRVEPLDPVRQDIGLMRPEAFEWPVHLDMPPHGPGQIRASTGFARFRVPPADAQLGLLLDSGSLSLVRDPERRILTKVSFDAAPVFEDAFTGAIDREHARCVAGFDLHELDLDDLARLDTAEKPEFELNPMTWERARRVARIERVSAETARLMPDVNHDWQGWQAHYPSETWRLENRASGRTGQSVPRRAPWYSAAESTIGFARRVPRLRLFPTASEAAVADLLSHGQPNLLAVSIIWSGPDNSKELAEKLNAGSVLEWTALGFGAAKPPSFLDLNATTAGRTLEIRPTAGFLSPAQLRAALLGICCRVVSDLAGKLVDALADGDKLVCMLTVSAWNKMPTPDGKPMSTVVQPVTLPSPLHPVLEETIGELEYSASNGGLYRRYVVSVQPVQPVEATTMADFLAHTSPEADPYGWAALQQLGLARTVRLYDRDLDRFLSPEELLTRVHHVFEQTASRYVRIYADADVVGKPFVDVLLRPGQDRVAGPFDAVLAGAGEEIEHDSLILDDAGLSIAQLSLRPFPVPVRSYYRLDMCWEPANWPQKLLDVDPDPLKPKQSGIRSLMGYELEFTAVGQPCELSNMVNGELTELLLGQPGLGQPVRLQLQNWKKGEINKLESTPDLQFFLRAAVSGGFQHPTIRLLARVRTSITTEGGELIVREERYLLEDLKKLIEKRDTSKKDFPSRGLVGKDGQKFEFVAVTSPGDRDLSNKRLFDSPYERFKALKPDQWGDELQLLNDCDGAFRHLRTNLRFAAPGLVWPADATTDQFKDLAATYVPWSQRFLAHGAGLAQVGDAMNFALAAPIKANPLNLAADAHGQISLSFLHADRWAHARVYAVRPTPRYQNLALGAGYYAEQSESEQLVTEGLILRKEKEPPVLKRALGYAVAVSPRTERIEPPVILGSRLVDSGQWELVVARHGEEALAFSNRPLFARLGTEGTALSFVREYRDPDWPDRLNKAITDNSPPTANLYPERIAALPVAATDAAPAIDGPDLGTLAHIHPSLWKGADVWRIGQLPAHYRVTALAVARAGLVVSRVVTSVQDATPRRPLNPLFRNGSTDEPEDAVAVPKPVLHIKRNEAGKAEIRIEELRLVSHADLSLTDAVDWFQGGVDDIAWWPDPNVRYTLLRRGSLGAGRRFEDEDADINLVANPMGVPATEEPQPVVVRCRGTRFLPAAADQTVGGHDGRVRVDHSVQGGRRYFTLGFGLARVQDVAALERQRIGLPAAQDDVTIKFNEKATAFAKIANQVTLDVGPFIGAPNTRDEAQAWLIEQGGLIRTRVAALRSTVEPVLLPACDCLDAIAAAMLAEAEGLPTANYKPELARVERRRSVDIELPPTPLEPLTKNATFPFEATARAQVLTLHDLPAGGEADAAYESGHEAARRNGGRLWAACHERLLGAGSTLAIRAVDTRNAIEKTADGWQAPGEMETEIVLPDWAKWGSGETT
jgi:hypothetical protein